jgi:hypothetical protein
MSKMPGVRRRVEAIIQAQILKVVLGGFFGEVVEFKTVTICFFPNIENVYFSNGLL